MLRMNRGAVLVIAIVCAGVTVDASAQTCDRLAALRLANGKVTWARDVAAGAFSPPNGPMAPGTNIFGDLPAFCRFAAILTPSTDSTIQIEVWLPTQGWNGKFLAVGNGAWQGSIVYPAMAEALRRGYATSSTDTGHVGGGASFGMGHPEKVTDFAYRAVHEMTVTAKAVVQAFYDRAPQHAYWNGCSAGGRQALKAAQMFPADFDGIIAGAPGLDWSGRSAQAVRIAQALHKPEARFTPAALQVLHTAVVAACDATDGTKDGLIENPAACRFDPSALTCSGGSGSACLAPPQVESARLIYSPIVDAKTKREIPGLAPGSELGWTELGWSLSARATGLDHFRYLVFADPKWDVAQFNVAADVSRLSDGVSGAIDARDPNLKAFFARGGKLLQYHGWSDPQITPLASTAYYERVAAANGGSAAIGNSYRLFMAPGMGHCRGGEGPDDFDKIAALERWVEQGQAPDRIVASHRTNGKIDRTRPLCPYPQVARYLGTGSIDEAANFVCEARADESGAVQILRFIASAQHAYAASCGKGLHAPSLAVLARRPPGSQFGFLLEEHVPPMGATVLEKHRYRIEMTATRSATSPADCNGTAAGGLASAFTVTARPLPGFSGASYQMDTTGQITEIK
jgi:feruloyl esterase